MTSRPLASALGAASWIAPVLGRIAGFALMAVVVMILLSPGVALSACPQERDQNTTWVARARTAAGSEDGIGGSGRSSGPGSSTLVSSRLISSGTADPERTESLALSGAGSGMSGGDDDGIGGSGYSRGDEDDGIGGSGLFGTVTGFGSICMNGRRIQYDPEVPVSLGGLAATSEDLDIGHVVTVVASGQQAESIDVVYVVVGTVEGVDESGFTVMGQLVQPAKGSIVDRDALVVGKRVAVSGLRRPDGSIAASRVDAAHAALPDRVAKLDIEDLFGSSVDEIDVEGYVHAADAEGLNLGFVQINAVAIESVADGQAAARPDVGARVRVRASRTEAGIFEAVRVELIGEVKLLRNFQRLDLERSSQRRSGRRQRPDTGATPRAAMGHDAHPQQHGPGAAGFGAPEPGQHGPQRPDLADRPSVERRPEVARPERVERPERPSYPRPDDRPQFRRPERPRRPPPP
jgi:hypothetical protein